MKPSKPSLTWTTQPPSLLESPVLLEAIPLGEGLAEVREAPEGAFYLTLGSLWGSQTLRCADVRALLRGFQAASRHEMGDPPLALPEGCTLMESGK